MQKFIRKIQKDGTHSFTINIPKELVKRFNWRERQRVELVFGGRKHAVILRDWKPRKRKK